MIRYFAPNNDMMTNLFKSLTAMLQVPLCLLPALALLLAACAQTPSTQTTQTGTAQTTEILQAGTAQTPGILQNGTAAPTR